MNKYQAPNSEELQQALAVVEVVESLVAEKQTVYGSLVRGTDIYQKLPTASKDISCALRFQVLKRDVYRDKACFYVDQQVLSKLLEGRETMAHPMIREDFADEAIELKGRLLSKQDILDYMTEENQGLTVEEAEASFQEAIAKERIVKVAGEEDLYDLPESITETSSGESSQPKEETTPATTDDKEPEKVATGGKSASVDKEQTAKRVDMQKAINEFPNVVRDLMPEHDGMVPPTAIKERLGLTNASAYVWNKVRLGALEAHESLKHDDNTGSKMRYFYTQVTKPEDGSTILKEEPTTPEVAEEKPAPTQEPTVSEPEGSETAEPGAEEQVKPVPEEPKTTSQETNNVKKNAVIIKDEVMGSELTLTKPTDLMIDNGAITYGAPGNFEGRGEQIISLKWGEDGKPFAEVGGFELLSGDDGLLVFTKKA